MIESLATDPASGVPLYLQLQARIREAMKQGRLKEAEALPSERDLAQGLGISRVTVRRAIAGLVEQGVLVQRRGSGTFVAPQIHVEQRLSRLSGFTEDMLGRGMTPSALCFHRSSGPATPEESMALGLAPGQSVTRIHRLRVADGLPMAIDYAALPGAFLSDPDIVRSSLYRALADHGRAPCRALQHLKAIVLDAERAALLQVPAGSAALYIERRSFLDSGEAVEFTRSYYRGDTYDFVAELSAGDLGGPDR